MQLHPNNTSNKSKALVSKIVNKMEGLKKPRKFFIISLLILFISMRGRHTFKGMASYGSYCEKSYRLHFEEPFDYLSFNSLLLERRLSKDCIIVFDPSYLPKSGKCTPHIGNFWNGCLGKAVKGIEIGGLGVVDVCSNTAFGLEAIQTLSSKELQSVGQSLVDHYAQVIIDRKQALLKLSNYLVVDGYFAKQNFVDKISAQTDFTLIGKLRSDANLQYFYNGPKRKGRGRPKKYGGKVNTKKIDKRRFKQVYQDNDLIIYEALVWSVGLKRKVKVAYVEFLRDGKATGRYGIYFSTDLMLDGESIYFKYKARFQIEFLFRDAKQHTGLTHCQARSENKIHFHVNASLTAVNVAKVVHHHTRNKKADKPFSMTNIKKAYFNEFMLNLFFANFHFDPELDKNKKAIKKVLNLGIRAA